MCMCVWVCQRVSETENTRLRGRERARQVLICECAKERERAKQRGSKELYVCVGTLMSLDLMSECVCVCVSECVCV